MHADASSAPMAGLPDPEHDRQFYDGVPARRLVAWFIDLAIVLAVGVPVAVVFGLVTLGFGFALFPLARRRRRLSLSHRDDRRRLGDLGHARHRHRVPPRRRLALRPADGAPAHRRSTRSHSASSCCSSISCVAILGYPLPPGPARHHPRHHRDQPAGRLIRRAFTRGRRILLPAADSCCYPRGQGGTHPGPHMRHSLPQSHQFYVTAPQPCPYLPGKVERKLFTALQGDGACHLNDVLSHQGFRRSQNVLYRPSCAGCSACLSARIVVGDFTPSRGQRRVLRRNAEPRAGGAQPLGDRRAVPASSAATSTPATPPAAWPTWT